MARKRPPRRCLAKPQPDQDRGDPLTAQHLEQRFGGIPADSISTNRNSIMIAPVVCKTDDLWPPEERTDWIT